MIIQGTNGVDILLGTSSNDIIYGFDGNDTLKGGKGADSIYGGGGNDTIYGEAGNDFLDGNSGSDTLYGDAGNDVFHYSYNENLGSTDVYDGGTGTDKLVLSFNEAEYATLSTSINNAVAAFNSPKAPAIFNFNQYITNMNLSVTKIESLVINVAPKAVSDSTTTNEMTPIIFNVLANDSDFNGNLLTLSNITGMPLGTSASIVNNKIYFDPGTAFHYLTIGDTATVVLTYSVTDGYATSNAQLNITITGVGPVARADHFNGLAFGALDSANVLTNDAGAVSAELVSGPERASSFTFYTDGTFDYTPQAGFFGTDTFIYRAFDGFNYSAPKEVLLDMLYHAPLRSDFSPSDAFNLNSNPYATKTIFLDFDGHVTTNTAWNADNNIAVINTPAFSLDGDLSSFSTTELNAIIDSWYQIQEDFAPFNVNVTTLDLSSVDPNWLNNTGAGDAAWGMTLAIGGAWNDWLKSSAGGVAYEPSFGAAYYNTAFIFEDNIFTSKDLAEISSHEIGHTLGVSHDGVGNQEYYLGNDLWAPIMGTAYNSTVTQWSKGEYPNANNLQDDLATITTRTDNGFSYRLDDHSNDVNSFSDATLLQFNFSDVNPGTAVLGSQGVIETRQDIDVFTFNVDSAHNNTFDLKVSANSIYPNLNIEASLIHFNTNGTPISTQVSNPSNNLSASFDNLAAGSYIVSVAGVGDGDPLTGGYSDYASLGNYNIFGVG